MSATSVGPQYIYSPGPLKRKDWKSERDNTVLRGSVFEYVSISLLGVDF